MLAADSTLGRAGDPPERVEPAMTRSGSAAMLALGIAAISIAVIGSAIVVVVQGITPVESLVAAIESSTLGVVLLCSAVLGLVALVGGVLTGRAAPDIGDRRRAFAGAILGAQAIVLALAVLWWRSGDVSKFVENFLAFDVVTPEIDAFLRGALNTLKLAGAAELIGLALGLALAILAVSSYSVARAPARVYINFFRATPLLWQLSFVYFGITLGLQVDLSAYTAGIIALSLNTAAYLAEVFRAGLQSIERSQLDAARGLGLSHFQAMRTVIVPQAVLRVIPPLMNDFVVLIKDTSLVLFLGLALSERELMSVGQEGYSDTFNATFFVFTALGYLAICLPLIRLVNFTEKRLRSGLVGVAG